MASAANIPLKCDICPKKPRFSDVSHLLTHISSKTHLSNIFKARVRLETDTECRRLVEDYDQWYAEWSIQDLLAERLSQKDSKMSKPRARATPTARMANPRGRGPALARLPTNASNQPGFGSPSLLQSASHLPYGFSQGGRGFGQIGQGMMHPTGAGIQPVTSGASLLRVDPNLQNQAIFNGQPTPFLPPPAMLSNFAAPRHDNNKRLPRLAGQSAATFARAVSQQPTVDPNNGKRKAALDSMAKMRQIMREDTVDTNGTQTMTQVTTPLDSDDWSIVSTPDGSWIIPTSELHHLPNLVPKGLNLPGMGAFDAATPEQKAKRNQKKPEDAYLRLEAISVDIRENGGWESKQQIVDEPWFLDPVGAKLITGHPTPSSLASSSPAPTPRQLPSTRVPRSATSALRTRKARAGPSTERDHRTSQALIDHVVPRGRIDVYRNDAEDDDADSVNTFSYSRPSRLTNAAKRRKTHTNQENDFADSLSGHATVKTDADATDAGAFALPSIEQPRFYPQYPTTTPTFGSSLGQTSIFPPATMQPNPYTASPTRPMTSFGMNGYGMNGHGMSGFGMNGFGNASSPARGMPAYISAHNNGQVLTNYDEDINFYTGPGGPMPATRTFPQPHQSSSPTRIGYTGYAPASRPQPSMPANSMTFGFPTPSAAAFTFPPPTQTFSPTLNTGLSPVFNTGLSPMLNGGVHNNLGMGMNTTAGLDNLAQAATQDADGAGILASGGVEDDDRTVTAPGSGDGPTGA